MGFTRSRFFFVIKYPEDVFSNKRIADNRRLSLENFCQIVGDFISESNRKDNVELLENVQASDR